MTRSLCQPFICPIPLAAVLAALALSGWLASLPSDVHAQSQDYETTTPTSEDAAAESDPAANSDSSSNSGKARTSDKDTASDKAESTTAEDSEAVKAGRKALRSSARFPWYDADKDELSRIKLPKEAPEPDPNVQPTQLDWAFPDWFVNPIATLIQVGIYLILAILLGLILFLLVRAYLNREAKGSETSRSGDDEDVEGDADRMDALPFPVARPRGDLLSEARRLYEAGDYAQAIVYLFSYQLVALDRHQAIHLVRGKTNRQYVQELRPQQRLAAMVTHTMLAFEDVFFGRYPLERQRFEACWNELNEFHQILQKAGTA